MKRIATAVLMGLMVLGMGQTTKPATQPGIGTLKDNAPKALKEMWPHRLTMLADARRSREDDLRKYRVTLASMRRGVVGSHNIIDRDKNGVDHFIFDGAQEKAKAVEREQQLITAAEADLERLKSVKFEPPRAQSLEVGVIGYVVISDVLQVIDTKTMIVSATASGKTADLWLTDFDTAGIVDGRKILRIALFISGTHRYSTVDGSSRTIAMAIPFKIEDYLSP